MTIRTSKPPKADGLRLVRAVATGQTAAEQDAALAGYMAQANLRFVELSRAQPVIASIADFPAQTFARIVLPPATILWPRDRHSRDRLVVLRASEASFEMVSDGLILRRDPDFFLVAPGVEPVEFRALAPTTELLYMSTDVSALGPVEVPTSQDEIPGPIPDALAAPLVGLIGALASRGPRGATTAEPLASVAREVARSLVGLFTEDEGAGRGLFTAAIAVIAREHHRVDLSPATIAARLRVATRTLQTAFTQRGTTISRELRAARVRTARALRRAEPALSTGRLAEAAGFGSASALHRALREQREDPAGD